MTKEEVLQKVNDYCDEKSYTSETLTDDFKEKFSDFFAKKYDSETSVDDEGVIADIKFNINTAFSATSKGLTSKQETFTAKEREYQRQIAELTKRNQGVEQKEPPRQEPQIPDEIKKKLERLERFETESRKAEKFKEVLVLAKKNIREDLHKSLENYASDFDVTLDEDSSEQAKKLTQRFQNIFRDSIGDIKPLSPKVNQKRDEELIDSIPKIKI